MPVAGCGLVLVHTQCYLCICQEEENVKTFLQSAAQIRGRAVSPAEAEVLTWAAATAWSWRTVAGTASLRLPLGDALLSVSTA